MRHPPFPLLALATGALLAGVAACGDGRTGGVEVASLAGSSTTSDASGASRSSGSSGSPGTAPETPEDAQEAALAYAKCMREHGVDMPDPQFDAGGAAGAVAIEIDGDGGDLEAASEACGPLLGPAGGSFTPPDPEEQARFEESMLAYARCMREHGIDFPDPQVDGGMVQIGGEGIDPRDPDFTEADSACRGELPGDGPAVVAGKPASGEEP